jgi:predicted nucleic acid-binding protein
MSARVFFDSNVLVYAFGQSEQIKAATAQNLVIEGAALQNAVISYQVLQECVNVALKKFSPPLSPEEAKTFLDEVVADLEVIPWSFDLLKSGLEVKQRFHLAWYDSLIVAAALAAKCETLYTEDLQHGQVIDGTTIVNPFL